MPTSTVSSCTTGALKGTPNRWLDIRALLRLIYPKNDFIVIRYFTAPVQPLPHDLDQPNRQQTYLRALRTLPEIRLHFGQFTCHTVRLPLASTIGSKKPKYAKVVKTEEKGSDVSLAANLVNDAHNGVFEAAIVVTNDSDLIEPIKLVTDEVGLPVGVLNPCKQPAGGLKAASSFYTVMRHTAPSKCQFSIQLKDKNGTFTKPESW
ncbi:MAG: NYN domain-containing protein [Thermoanaerobaculales bacterium]|jgi:hypothetical protein|nr:NYN domain-containing protein [Thermoanaerobaculales bacterium]